MNIILLILSFITPRSFALFETPFASMLSTNTLFLYPALISGYPSEFYINTYSVEGFVIATHTLKKIDIGEMVASFDSSLTIIGGFGKGFNKFGFHIQYERTSRSMNASVISYSHRTPDWGYDLGLLYDRRLDFNYYSAYMRGFYNLNDQLDFIAGLRDIRGRANAVSGFLSFIRSPVSGQYMEFVAGYNPWQRNFYITLGISHQYYRNFALSMGMYYPLYDLTSVSRATLSRFESQSEFPDAPCFRIALEFQDNAGLYTLSLGFDYKVIGDFIGTGRFTPSSQRFKPGISIYFYTF